MAETNELTTLIDKLITERTFSVEGVKAIEALRAKAEAQASELARKDDMIRSLREASAKENAEITCQRAQIETLGKDLAAIREREGKIVDHEKARAVAEATASTFREAMNIVFRPNTVREAVQSNVPTSFMPPGSSYPQTNWHTETKQVTREEGV
jgi:hypothetical protein